MIKIVTGRMESTRPNMQNLPREGRMNGIWSSLGTDDLIWVKPSAAAIMSDDEWWFGRIVRPLSTAERNNHIAARAPLTADPVERAKMFGPLYWIEWCDGPFEGKAAIVELDDENARFYLEINNL